MKRFRRVTKLPTNSLNLIISNLIILSRLFNKHSVFIPVNSNANKTTSKLIQLSCFKCQNFTRLCVCVKERSCVCVRV